MRLEAFWGVGPKTAALLESTLGVERAVDAIESGDFRVLVDAGVPSGRATRILRRARGGAGMDVLATADSRATYRKLLALIRPMAVNRGAEDRIRLLTPMLDREAIEERQERIDAARTTWRSLPETSRRAVLEAFAANDGGGEHAAVSTALELRRTGVDVGVFAPLSELPEGELERSAAALAHLDGDRVRSGYDETLDALTDRIAAVDDLRGDTTNLLERIRSGGVRASDDFREAYVEAVVAETGVDPGRVRETAPTDAVDADDFLTQGLRSLSTALRSAAEEREATVAADLRTLLEGSADVVDEATAIVDDLGELLSLARFAEAYDLVRPTILPRDRHALAMRDARNLSLAAGDDPVQPVTYAIGEHPFTGLDAPPSDDRVAVLTGANSGGKTTLLETCCQVAILAQLGLPVPADEAVVSLVDSIVFHRRHASFNAGVLESTLRTIVPPLADDGRTLMLVDEFEAITEPGSAANLLHGLVRLTVERDAMGVFVTHLAEDLKPLPDPARIDGIVADGLAADGTLAVDYQPRFDEIGRSTPEFIVARLVADASDRSARAGYETLAGAVGAPVIQRTLLDDRWSVAR